MAWADKFKIEMSSGADEPHSPVLDALRRSTLIALVNRRVFRPIGALLAAVLDRLQPLPGYDAAPAEEGQAGGALSPRRLLGWALAVALAVIALIGLWFAVRLLMQVNLATWGTLFLAAIFTWLRTLAALYPGIGDRAYDAIEFAGCSKCRSGCRDAAGSAHVQQDL